MLKFSTNQPDPSQQYLRRPGAYAIITNHQGLIGIIKTKKGYFLPGGGIEGDESLEECLKRECLEEIGTEISIISPLAEGNYYFYSTTLKLHMESIGHFFVCKIKNILEIPTEDDHELLWMEQEEALPLMYLENQRKAIEIFYKN